MSDQPRPSVISPGYRKGMRPANYGMKLPGEVYEPYEVLRLLDAIPQTRIAGLRDRALLALLWRTGLRISEALSLREIDLPESTGYVRVRRTKNFKARDVTVFGSGDSRTWGWDQLRPWMEKRAALGVSRTAPVFCLVHKGHLGHRLTDQQVRMALGRYVARAGLDGRFHLHGFRHTLTAELFRGGVSLMFLQRHLGHSSLAVTQQYLESIGAADVMDALAEYRPSWTAQAA